MDGMDGMGLKILSWCFQIYTLSASARLGSPRWMGDAMCSACRPAGCLAVTSVAMVMVNTRPPAGAAAAAAAAGEGLGLGRGGRFLSSAHSFIIAI